MAGHGDPRVTEFEWLNSTDVERMISASEVHSTLRKAALLGVAWFRQIAESVSLMDLNWSVGVLEKMADGKATDQEVNDANRATDFNYNVTTGSAAWITKEYKTCNAYPASWAVYHYLIQISPSQVPSTRGPLWEFMNLPWTGFLQLIYSGDQQYPGFVDFLRCILGNPFRPVAFLDSWRSEATVALASAIYADRAFDRLPVLADALEEAGCDYPDVLAHCRGPGPHSRGCWVVDGVLGKS